MEERPGIHAKVSPKLLKEAQQIAVRWEVSLSYVIRKALTKFVAEQKGKK